MEKIAYPPNYREIVKHFPAVASSRCLFAWGEDVFNPHNMRLTPSLKAHEAIHGRRQLEYKHHLYGTGVRGWWEQYLTDPKFRLREELYAHRMEYLTAAAVDVLNRQQRRGLLKQISKKLTSPIYGFKLKGSEALRLVRDNPA